MNICYLCPDLGIPLDGHKGAAAHVRGLVRAFEQLGHSVTVVASGARSDSQLGSEVVRIRRPAIAREVISDDNPRMARALGHIWHNVSVEHVLTRVIAERKPDLIYERYSPFGVAGSLVGKSLGVPHVLEVNALLSEEGRRFRRQAMSETSAWLEKRTFEAAQLIITVSEPLRSSLVDHGVAADKVVTVSNGVDSERFDPEGPSLRSQFADKTVIGFVGSLKPWHDIQLLADAFAELADDPDYHLLVVGEGPMMKILQALAENLPGRVTLTGGIPHDQVAAYVRTMDIAVASYVAMDTFYFSPLKALEYMAAGCAVVATDIGQLHEMVRHQETGWLVPPGDRGAMTDAIRTLGRDPETRRRLGRAASDETRKNHTWQQRAATILDHAAGRFGLAESGHRPRVVPRSS